MPPARGYLPPPSGVVSLLPIHVHVLTAEGLVELPAHPDAPEPTLSPGSALGLPCADVVPGQARLTLPDLSGARVVVVGALLAAHLLAHGQCVADAEVYLAHLDEDGLWRLARLRQLETHNR